MHWSRLQAETPAREDGGPERVVTQGLSVPEPVVAMLREHAAFLQEQGRPGLPIWCLAALLLCGNHSDSLGPTPCNANQPFWRPPGTSFQIQSGPSMLRAAA